MQLFETMCNKKEIPLSNLLQIASDGASAMNGKHDGFTAKLNKVAPRIMTNHCNIH